MTERLRRLVYLLAFGLVAWAWGYGRGYLAGWLDGRADMAR